MENKYINKMCNERHLVFFYVLHTFEKSDKRINGKNSASHKFEYGILYSFFLALSPLLLRVYPRLSFIVGSGSENIKCTKGFDFHSFIF